MRTGAFEPAVFAGPVADTTREDLQALIAEASIRPQEVLPEDEIGCGDIFPGSGRKHTC